MDETAQVVNEESPWEIQTLNDTDIVFRQVPVSQRETHRQKKIPSESHFALREDEDSLSFNLKGIVDVSKNFKLMGITHTKKQTFVNVTAFKIFQFPVAFLKAVAKFERITHTPVFHDAPSPVGTPNNKAHLSLFCDDFSEGTRIQLQEHCLANDCECAFDINSIRDEIAELIARNNQTPYHNYWVFED